MSTSHFSPDALLFLKDLAANNDRSWFEDQRLRYETSLLTPFLTFLLALQPKLERFAPHFVVDARARGGSVARIQRDMRFVSSHAAAPYKTALSAHLAHLGATDGARPSLFIVLEPGKTRIGGGVRDGDIGPFARKSLKELIEREPEEWRRVMNKAVEKGATRARFTMTVPIADDVVTTARFLDDVVAACRAVVPFVDFIARGVGVRATSTVTAVTATPAPVLEVSEERRPDAVPCILPACADPP